MITEMMFEVKIPLGKSSSIMGSLTIPKNSKAIVTFAHGSGSGRLSPRNQFVARKFNQAGLATLLVDLLTPEEDEIDMATAEYRFNIDLLAERLLSATRWLHDEQTTKNMSFGYFGASTGAAAALISAAKNPGIIKAIVSRGGRPDLAGEYLSIVSAPTLFLVGGYDEEVMILNEQAMAQMNVEMKLVIIPGATHLFGEHGKLDEVAKLSTEWFLYYLH